MINFKVVIPVYNSEKWISKCINSVVRQHYTHWDGIIINDGSTDGTSDKIMKATKKVKKFLLAGNLKRKLALHNIVGGIVSLNCSDEDVIVLIDGDDWLPDAQVFDKLVKMYMNPNVWLTYGSYEIYPENRISDKTRPATIHDNPRKGPMIYRHLRTFKYFLWKNIRDESLRYSVTGDYYPCSYDVAIMRPMVEMAGLEHILHISTKMYVYNFANPLRDGKVNNELQKQCGNEIALHQKPYSIKTKEELKNNENH